MNYPQDYDRPELPSVRESAGPFRRKRRALVPEEMLPGLVAGKESSVRVPDDLGDVPLLRESGISGRRGGIRHCGSVVRRCP